MHWCSVEIENDVWSFCRDEIIYVIQFKLTYFYYYMIPVYCIVDNKKSQCVFEYTVKCKLGEMLLGYVFQLLAFQLLAMILCGRSIDCQWRSTYCSFKTGQSCAAFRLIHYFTIINGFGVFFLSVLSFLLGPTTVEKKNRRNPEFV